MNSTESGSALTALSADLTRAVEQAARSIVAVETGSRFDASGVLWRPGLVVTTHHSLENDEDLDITLPDGTAVKGNVTGRDPSTDLATIAVDAVPASTPAAFTADADLKVGALVLALTRDSETGVSASLGVTSTLGPAWRTWRGGHVDRFIRADVSVYPGYSGGPLIDGAGRIIGINTSGLSRRLGVTLPASTVNRVIDALAAGGRIARGYLGVGMQPVRLPQALQQSLKFAGAGGVIVVAIEAGGPADRSGLMIGDVFVAINGSRVEDVDDVQALLGSESVGKTLPAQLIRAGALVPLDLHVGERPSREE